MRTSSLSEKPDHQQPRRLADWLNPTGARKVHSLVDKVYKRKNLELAWEKVKANKGAGEVSTDKVLKSLKRCLMSNWINSIENSKEILTAPNQFDNV